MDVHFYTSEPLGFKEWLGGLNGYHESWYALSDENRKELHTTQLALLGEPLLANGHRVFIQIPLQDEFEIKLGKNDHTQREIRKSHNLLKLLLNGEFGTIL